MVSEHGFMERGLISNTVFADPTGIGVTFVQFLQIGICILFM